MLNTKFQLLELPTRPILNPTSSIPHPVTYNRYRFAYFIFYAILASSSQRSSVWYFRFVISSPSSASRGCYVHDLGFRVVSARSLTHGICGIALLNLGKALFHCLGRGIPIYMRHAWRALLRSARVCRARENIGRGERGGGRMRCWFHRNYSFARHLPLHLMVMTLLHDSSAAIFKKKKNG